MTTAVAVLAALVVAVGPVLPTPLKEGVDWLRGYLYRLQRPGLPGEPGWGKPRFRRMLADFAGSRIISAHTTDWDSSRIR
jgi:hypothetical protein